jgi:hypothetical protein
VQGDQLTRVAEVAGGRGVADCVVDVLLIPVPDRGTPMQLANETRRRTVQLVAQQFSKEMVVAVPLTARVEGDEEQVRALDRVELLGSVAATGNRVAARCAHPLEDRCLEQEVA